MPLYGLTIHARDEVGPHYVNYTVRAASLEAADAIVQDHYDASDEELFEFDQAVELEGDDSPSGRAGIVEVLGKVYHDEERHAEGLDRDREASAS